MPLPLPKICGKLLSKPKIDFQDNHVFPAFKNLAVEPQGEREELKRVLPQSVDLSDVYDLEYSNKSISATYGVY